MNKKEKTSKAFLSKAGGEKKPLIIGIIAIGAILVLSLLVFFGKEFVGKAIYFTAPEGFTAGAVDKISLPIIEGKTLTLKVGALIPEGSESVAYEFQLDYPSNILTYLSVKSAFPEWKDTFLRVSVSGGDNLGSVKLEHATIDFTRSMKGGKAYQLAEVTFLATQDITEDNFGDLLGTFLFSDITVLDMNKDHQDLFPDEVALVQPSGEEAKCPDCPICPEGKDWWGNLGIQDVERFCKEKGIEAAKCVELPKADLNGDGLVNDGDIIIIQLAMLAAESRYGECGADNQNTCEFPGVFVCENLKSSYTETLACGGGQE